VVKAWFPARPGAVTGLYTAGLVAGAMLASVATVP
jgi:cyanate permease